MSKDRRPRKAKKVYSNQRVRKQTTSKSSGDEKLSDLNAVIKHSIEVLKLKIEKNQLKQLIFLCSRNSDNMEHLVKDYNEHMSFIQLKIDDRIELARKKLELFLGENADKYKIPNNFHLSSTNLKDGFVMIEDKDSKLCIIVLKVVKKPTSPFLNTGDIISEFNIKDFTELSKDTESLLKGETTVSTILSSHVSLLERDHPKRLLCYDNNCTHRILNQ